MTYYSPSARRRAFRGLRPRRFQGQSGEPLYVALARWFWTSPMLRLLPLLFILAACTPALADPPDTATADTATADTVLIRLPRPDAEHLLTLLDRDPEGHAEALHAARYDEPDPSDRLTTAEAWDAVQRLTHALQSALDE